MKIVFLIFNSNTDQLLVESHETKFLSPLELLDQFGIAELGNLVMPDGEGERFEKPVDDGHHVSPRTMNEMQYKAMQSKAKQSYLYQAGLWYSMKMALPPTGTDFMIRLITLVLVSSGTSCKRRKDKLE